MKNLMHSVLVAGTICLIAETFWKMEISIILFCMGTALAYLGLTHDYSKELDFEDSRIDSSYHKPH